ncbi:MAG: hypothetical protein ACPKPY_02135 [Nitrososphaeraceae archaeon]|jgi:hypothetical protein
MELKEIVEMKENSVIELSQEIRILKSLDRFNAELRLLKELVLKYESSTGKDVNDINGFVDNYPLKNSLIEIFE